MKRTFLVIASLCIVLFGCVNLPSLEVFETDEKDIVSYTADSTETSNENAIVSTETAEINTNEVESREEFIEEMKNIYLEIKEDAHTIGREKTQILFNEVPWASCFLDTNSKLQETDDKMELNNFLIPEPVSVSSMLGIRTALDDRFYDYDKYYNNNVGGVARPTQRGGINVAGYEADDCMLLFSAVLIDDTYILSDEHSALYAAEYTIKPNNVEDAKEDLKNKIIYLYGDPDNIREIEPYDNVKETNEYIYWYGANNTVLVLYVDDYDIVHISYVWLGGEELLKNALDSAENAQFESEEGIYDNGDTSGL